MINDTDKNCVKSPFFTVIIPTYNRGQLLKEAIQSVLDQTFQDFELIIVDDRSTDNTEEVARSFMKNDRIKYIMNNRTKRGAGARNAGLFKAKGEWITFLDDDDVWLPQKLEVQFNKIMEIDKAVGFIYGGYAVYDFERKKEVGVYLPEKEGWIQKDLLYDNYITAINSIAVRRDILLQVGGFDERFLAKEDWELYVRIMSLTKAVMIREILSYVRRAHSERISSNVKSQLQSALLFRQKYNDLIKKNPRLCHRIATIILIHALDSKDWPAALKALPWTFAGILINPYHFLKTMNSAIVKLCK